MCELYERLLCLAISYLVHSLLAVPEGYTPLPLLSVLAQLKSGQVERSTNPNPNPNKHGHLVHYFPSHLWYVLAHTQLVHPR
jgi:sugar/nucleoside kinase (ribokinase family)